ncbi:TIGR04104 family putative zinc finger protein [Virgibacillus xinjiangensis]|uniref:TIGR04104 family putative zinc finger protein n=1 Tax=Virgibacillus xinjiangensis TaxID=393090 RepID=A0ABV7CVY2_9BACI
MPVCKTCDNKWSWKETYIASFTLSVGMTCPYCGEKQYLTAKSRIKSSSISFVSPIIVLMSTFFDVSIALWLLILISYMFLIIIIIPFFYELTDEEEPLW